ncbi:MAG: glutamate--tRNA ligase family protein [Bacteroidia bacterium]|nr:glutamate--tRNA ligase family protein [Bacteroidia bacterium]
MDLEEPYFKTRISPTPSGFLHLGNALNFVYTWLMAKSHNAPLILRIDDLDAPRMRSEYVEDIFRTLDWLGLDYDEGPQSPDELQKTYSQSLRIDRYLEVIKELEEDYFICSCTRKQILKESEDGQYPGTCRESNLDPALLDKYAIRIKVPEGSFVEWEDLKQGPQRLNLYASMRDFVILRKDGIPAYQIASLVDDRDMGVNILVRGEDLKDSSAAQLFLAQRLGFDSFSHANFLHHPLLRGMDGEKLSKSAGALSIRELRKTSTKSSDIITQIAHMLGCPADLRINDVHELLLHVNHIEGLLTLSK